MTTADDLTPTGTTAEALAATVPELVARLDGLIADTMHFAQIYHATRHESHSGTWLSCDRGICPSLVRAISRARGQEVTP